MPIPASRQRVTKVLVQPAGGAEEPTHRSATRDHDPLRVTRSVPQNREQTSDREHLDVTEAGGEVDLLDGERVEELERCGHATERR